MERDAHVQSLLCLSYRVPSRGVLPPGSSSQSSHKETPHLHLSLSTVDDPTGGIDICLLCCPLSGRTRHPPVTTQTLAPSQQAAAHSLESAISSRGLMRLTINSDLTVTEGRLTLRADMFRPPKQNTSHWSLLQLTTRFASNL